MRGVLESDFAKFPDLFKYLAFFHPVLMCWVLTRTSKDGVEAYLAGDPVTALKEFNTLRHVLDWCDDHGIKKFHVLR